MAKALALTAVFSDGTSAEEAFLTYYPDDPSTGKPFAEDDGVWVKVRPISQKRYNETERRHTHKTKDQFARRLTEEVDFRKVQDDLIQFCVISWAGLAARNTDTQAWEPLEFAEEFKTKLPSALKNSVINFAMESQSVEVPAQSFHRIS